MLIMKQKTILDDEFIISQEDINICRGSGELKDCPFCGRHAIICGQRNHDNGNVVYTVSCSGSWRCMASMWCCCATAKEARNGAIEQWNRRI